MARIDALWPEAAEDLREEQILAAYAPPQVPWLRMNFVESLDGAVTREGLSGGLGGAADRLVFDLMRWWADVVLVGAGTARTEGYGSMRLPDDAASWRLAHGLAEQPVLALVSGRLDLDPASPLFVGAPVRPLVLTVGEAPRRARERLAEVADVVDAGTSVVDPARARAVLADRGLGRIHAEGGPTLFGTFLAAGAVDELCLTLAPTLEAGGVGLIARSPESAPTAMRLAGILRGDDELLLRYTARPADQESPRASASGDPSSSRTEAPLS
ncbi:pyrimidine reductase family protein [Brachybacterium sp. J153]|uniref:pyrimidine reductase family protein n=1 Tax=Brachybacterium sp. J153 TaxID=3116488 RepID=UPI002E78D441|nr:pyrimidine reductase family protein [Brachybacterium sp. J153]MEE1619008.1 pyrimidine reductase family protein [Brachybacterium sp. J153]